jgi:hypothetical protein
MVPHPPLRTHLTMLQITLTDGMSIAIDWHYVVQQEILDLQKSSELIQHPSMKDHQTFHVRPPLFQPSLTQTLSLCSRWDRPKNSH